MEQRMDVFRTPITDLLDAHGVRYRLLRHAEAVFTVEAAARQRGVLLEEMVKSILLREAGQNGRYVAPIGLPDDVPVIFDEAIGRLTRCNISSGDPLCGLELSAADLLRVSHGRLAAIVDVSK
jgi:prolyl-tRNA editing enzyme YbaK/EbsC (Cys-tRNA(Pro) deacylase)